jgi:hypothetical protein
MQTLETHPITSKPFSVYMQEPAKYIYNLKYRSVPASELGPPPPPANECVPPLRTKGGGDALACGRGSG